MSVNGFFITPIRCFLVSHRLSRHLSSSSFFIYCSAFSGKVDMFRRYLAPLFLLVVTINADVYLHFPPGSNNRVNENTANRANDQNAFDSQNNEKGGYNVPDATNQSYGNNASLQYYLVSMTFRSVVGDDDSSLSSQSNSFRNSFKVV